MATINDLQQLFSTKERLKILEEAVSGRPISIPKISAKAKVNKGLISKYMKILLKLDIVRRSGRSYTFSLEGRMSRAVKMLLNVSAMDLSGFDKHVKGIGVYGSYANGTNTEKSDIDIWIKVDGILREQKVAETEHGLGRKLGKEAHILVLDKKKLMRLKANDPVFYYSLAFGSFVLWGEGIEDRIR